MAISSLELQKAIFTALSASGRKVFEIVPPNTPFPYIVIGEDIIAPNNTKVKKGFTHNTTIHTWTRGSSSIESKHLNDFVLNTLLNGFKVNGFSLDSVTLEMQTTYKEQDPEGTIFHGVLQFEIKLMEV